MVTHVVMFRWSRQLSEPELRSVARAFDDLSSVEEVGDLRHGADLGIRSGNADYVGVVTCPDWGSFLNYLAHPLHRHLAEDVTGPFTESRWSVQF